MQIAIRVVLCVAITCIFWTPLGHASSCDRECLRGFMTQYLNAVIAHNPATLPVSDTVRFTENTVETKLGEGIWKTATKLTPYRVDVIDVPWGVVGTHSVIEEGKNTVLLLVRLKVVDRKITEIETQVTRIQPGGMFSNPTELKTPREAMLLIPPKDKLNSREDLVRIGLKYPEGLKLGSFVKADTPFAPDSYRIENGYITAGKGCNLIAMQNLSRVDVDGLPSGHPGCSH